MAMKTGLGKGLDALFANNVVEEEKVKEGESIVNLKLIDVEPNRNQPRMNFDDEKIEELANSIKEYGVIQPIIVTKQNNYYQIVAGERRWRAAKKAGISEIPAIIRNYTEQTNKEVALIENIQREDLNPIEKATALKEIIEKYGMKQHELAAKLGISRSGIANTMRILNLDPRVIELAKQGKITEGHCRSLLNIEDPEKQYKAALYVVETGDSVREVEKQMKIKKKKQVVDQTRYAPIYQEIETKFRNFFGSQVKLNAGKRSGTIVIHYSSKDELNNLIDKIKQ
jgi:ParB family chromosome partitioning protein